MDREIVLDTETTGLDPIKGSHRITEIGCIELINHIPTGKTFSVYINPEREVEPEAFKITGLSYEFLKDKPKFNEIADQFLDFIKDDTLIIHNAPFDIKFLNFELRFSGRRILSNPIIDTLVIAKKMFPGSPANLDALCKKFNIDAEKRVLHGALIDCELLAEVYLQLIGGPQKYLFNTDEQQKNITTINNNNKIQIKARKFEVNQEELLAHNKFIAQIKNPLWMNN